MSRPTLRCLHVLLSLLAASGATTHVFAQGQPGAALSRGMQLVYASQGVESAPWVVDSLDLHARYGTATTCSYVRFGQRDVRRTCVRGDTLFTWRDSTAMLVATRPLQSGMTMTLATANNGSAVYETAGADTVSVSGVPFHVVKTTVTTRDANGKVVRRLRERYALALGTATDGVFETMQPDGTWLVTQQFSMVRTGR